MIHARTDGETFGLAIGEFSSLNKPIITCRSSKDNAHLDILGDKAIIYDSKPSLISIFKNIKEIIQSRNDWNCYKEYNPENVMKQFNSVFLTDNIRAINIDYDKIKYIDINSTNNSKINYNYNDKSNLFVVTAFLDIDRSKWNNYGRNVKIYLESFYNFFNYDNNIIAFIDEKYIDDIIKYYNKKAIYKKCHFISINRSWMETNIFAWQQLDIMTKIMISDYYTKLVNQRINNGNPENIYPEYNAINHSKIDFISYAINTGLISKKDIVVWLDFGYFTSIFKHKSQYPSFSINKHLINPNYMSFFLRNRMDKTDEDTILTLINAPEKFTGSYFSGSAILMLELQKIYHDCLLDIHNKCISDDDQHIYLKCYLSKPDIFELYLNDKQWPIGLLYHEYVPDRYEIIKHLLSKIENGTIVEIGCDRGDLSNFILENNSSVNLFSIDPYITYNEYIDSINFVTGDNLYNKTNNLLKEKFDSRFNLIRKFSNNALNDVPDNLDLIYIDGNHKYNYVYEDINLWCKKLSPNGIIIGDDAVDTDETKRDLNGNIFIEWMVNCFGEYGVVKAFNDFIKNNNFYGKRIGNQYILCKNKQIFDDKLFKINN
jgi:hypothetical protein